ncbi:neuropathy target esterase sws-like [Oppia nitens]|uniref:neuropathy target esterase sws-like n=1 Tax=Oppia nitens TaxID=1686743 RepID=UPI0023DBBA9B|nr:neuropathy target esterase sws-like [Oppia nitens]
MTETMETLSTIMKSYLNGNQYIDPQISLLLSVVVVLMAIVFGFVFRSMRPMTRMTRVILPDPTLPRFRKRDKVMFYGRKMLRSVRSSLQATSRLRGKKRQIVLRFAKRLLHIKKDQPLTLQVSEPSQAFLEEEIGDQCEQPLPPEVIYMLKSIRVFGFFDKPLFLELCKNLEFVNVPKGQYLFTINDPDDSIFIVQTGRIQVSISELDGTDLILKEVSVGESIASMLSVMDVLTGHLAPFKTVSAKAIEESVIIRLQVTLFKQLLDKYPESLVRVVQVIMVRLQRVTFTALHHYLGLTTQLLNPGPITRRANVSSVVHTLHALPSGSSPPKTSPSRTTNYPSLQHSLSYSGTESSDLKQVLKEFAKNEGKDLDQQTEDLTTSDKTIIERKRSEGESPRRLKLINTYYCQLPENQKKRRRSLVSNENPIQGLTDDEIFNLAVEGLLQHLNIDDEELVKKKLVVKEYNAGVCLTSEDTHEENNLFYVLSGSIIVTQKSIDKDEENNLYIVYPGEIVGALSVITGEPSLFTIKIRQSCKVGVITKDNIYDILTEYPKSVLHLAHAVVRRLSPFVRQIDFALDWIHYESGRAIYRQGDKSDCTYIVLSGRLRSVITRPNGKKELVGEYGKGDLLGLVEVITQTQRSTTIMAVRDSELAKLPDGLVEAIKIKYPVVVTRLIHLLGHRLLGSLHHMPGQHSLHTLSATDMGGRPTGSNFTTVALLSVTNDVPLQAFSMELYHALTSIGPVSHLTSEFVRKLLGPTALEKQSEYRLCSWLGQQEDQHRIVLYQCDSHFSTWTQRCIRQADCILMIGLADQEPTVGDVEKQLEHLAIRTQKELVLLHKPDSLKPQNTVLWLNMRSWCSSHHHIRCPKRMFTKRSLAKTKEIYASIFNNPPSIHSDFSRLARFLTGTSIGLVLGGGGARGAAHVGMIKAITEAGIPIDMVGGVSIGAFMGALWCQENNITTFTQKARAWSHGMTSYWSQILDLTYPVTAMFTGHAFNRHIYEVFNERQIEDLWLPYFTVTTDITSSCPRIHRHGSLWRYVRSSMSLSGYLPPLCDPMDGHLLLDGGYVNNLPADVMRDVMGAETILAIDVGSQDTADMTNYGDTLNGWWLLWKRWNPFSKPVRVPNLPEIQSRLAYVSCVKLLEEVKQSDYCTYIRPPIDKYKTLQFGSFDEIMEVGLNHGKVLFSAMRLAEQKSLHSLLHKERSKVYHRQGLAVQNHASFTDLAERVCKIKTPNNNKLNLSLTQIDDISEDDDEYVSEPDMLNIGTDTDTDSAPKTLKHRKISTMF